MAAAAGGRGRLGMGAGTVRALGRVGWWLVAMVVALVGCGQGGGRGGRDRGEPLDVVRLDPQVPVTRVDVPLSPREYERVVAVGGEIVVLGGEDATFKDPDPNDEVTEFRYLADGARYEPGSGRWWPIAPIPVGPLYHPAGVWTGEELVVVGSPCGPGSGWVEEEDAEVCRPGGLWLGAYRPSTDSWRELARPVQFEYLGHRGWELTKGWAWGVSGVAWTGREAVFRMGAPSEMGRLLLVDPAAGTSRWGRMPVEGAGGTSIVGPCVIGEELLVVDGQTTAPFRHVLASPLRVLRLEGDGERWVEIDATPRPVTDRLDTESITCGLPGAGPVYLPLLGVGHPPLGEGVWWWDHPSRRWEHLPPVPSLPGVHTPNVTAALELEGHKVLMIHGLSWPEELPSTHPDPAEQQRHLEQGRAQLRPTQAWFVLGPGDREWRRVPLPDPLFSPETGPVGLIESVDGWMVSAEVLEGGEPRPGKQHPVRQIALVNGARLLGRDTATPTPTG